MPLLGNRLKKSLLGIPMFVVVAYAGIVGWFYVREDSLLYLPKKGLRSADSLNIAVEQVSLTTPDNVHLVAWSIPAAKQGTANFWLLYFHGNGGNISSRMSIERYKTFCMMGVNTFAVDYRGYGLSDGTPSELGLYTDALTAFNYLITVRHVPSHKIILIGHSLGAAVATDLAAKVDAGGLIVDGAFTSAPSLGQGQYPFLPVDAMMKNRFDSISKIRRVEEPKLFLHALHDEVVPFEQGELLFAAANEPKMFIETGGRHNTPHTADSVRFYGAIMEFLARGKRLNE